MLTKFAGPALCIAGNINRDVKVQNAPATPGLFEDGETPVSSIIETMGGGGANSACAAAGLGAKVRFMGKVGSDALGEHLCSAMAKLGIGIFVKRDPRVSTGNTVALGFSTGHRHFLSCQPNNETLAFDDLDLNALQGCGHLLRADVWFSQTMLEEGNRRLFTEAKRLGLYTSLDINFDPRWSKGSAAEISHRKQCLRHTLDLVDLAHGNVQELCTFTDTPDLTSALHRLTDWGVKAVVVHMGKQGAGFWTEGNLIIEPPCPVNNPVHSTGTGDVLSVSMILLHHRTDLDLPQKLKLANAVVGEFMEGRLELIPRL